MMSNILGLLKNLTIGKRLGLGLGLILALMLVSAFTGYVGIGKIYESTASVLQNEVKMMQYASKVRGDVQGMRRSEKDVLLNMDHQDRMEDFVKQWQDTERKAYE